MVKVWLFSSAVEQRLEEPCVPSSILGGATKIKYLNLMVGIFYFVNPFLLQGATLLKVPPLQRWNL